MEKNYCSCGCGKEIRPQSKWVRGHNPSAKSRFDWSNLESDYKKCKSIIKIAEMYGCTPEAVYYQMVKRGVKFNDQKIHIDNVKELYDKYKSVNKIANLLGCAHWTVRERLSELGIKLTHDNKSLNTEVGMGRYGEKIALSLLKGSKDMNKIDVHFPYDIEWYGVKIDVKVSKPRKKRWGQDYYSFCIRERNSDYYLLIALDSENFPRRLFLVPKEKITTKSVNITFDFNTKWNDYKLEVGEKELRKAVQNVALEV